MKKILKQFAFLAVAVIILIGSLPVAVLAAIPAAPSNLYCIPTSGQVDVYWTDNSADETGFNVQRAPDVGGLGPGTYASIGTAPAAVGTGTAVVFTDTAVTPQTAYWYRVAAVNASGSSFFSNETRVLTAIAAPGISLVTPSSGVLTAGAMNNISVNAAVSGTTISSVEYQFVADNNPDVFDARDIYSTQMDLTLLAPRAAGPQNNTMAVPANLPAGSIVEFEIRGTLSAVDAVNGVWTIGAPLGAMLGTPAVANTVAPLVVYESATGQPTSTKFVGSRHPINGDAVKVTAYRTIANGPLVARTITYIAPAAPPCAPALILSFLYNGVLTAQTLPVTAPGYLVSGETWTVGAGNFRVDASYFPAYIDANVGIGTPVTVRYGTMPQVANVARQIFNQIIPAIPNTTVLNPDFDTTPVAYTLGGTNQFNVPDGTWAYMIVDGVVSGWNNILGSWVVGNELIKTYQSNASIISPATIGDEVLFYCVRTLTPGPLVIESTYMILPGPLIQPYKPTAVEVHLMYNGNITYIGPNSWTVTGPAGSPITFVVDDPEGKARIDPLPFASFSVGMPVTVEFDRVGETLPDDANWAPLTHGAGNAWNGTLDLRQANVPANQTGKLYFRATDATKQAQTSGYQTSLIVLPTAAPVAPTNVAAVQTGSTAVTVSWSSAAGANMATGFIIERANGANPAAFTQIGTLPASPFVDNTVVGGNSYIYRVKGSNAIGIGAASTPFTVDVTLAPAAPTNLNAALLTTTSVALTWMDNANNEDGYRVERAPDVAGQPGTFVQTGVNLAANVTTFTDTITAGVIWHYRVIAFSNILPASLPSNVVMLSSAAPATPGTLVITLNKAALSATLTWVDMSTNERGFIVQRAPDAAGAPGVYATLNTTAANATTYTDATLADGTVYWYRVIAAGSTTPGSPTPDSTPTAAISVYIPTAPTNLAAVATAGPPIVVDLTWSDTPGEDGYRVERAPNNAGTPGTWTSRGTTAQNVATFSDTTAVANSSYWYRVIATTTAWGESAPSNTVNIITAAPVAPTNLNVALVNATTVNLSWNASSGATGYRVQSDAAAAGTFVQVGADLPAGTLSLSDTITAAAAHSYRVIAFSAFGPSVPSTAVPISYGAPGAPTGVTVRVTGSVTISWTDNSINETGFSILRAQEDPASPGNPLTPPGFVALVPPPANPTAPNVTSFLDTTVLAGTSYLYQVVALGGGVPDSGAAMSSPILNDIPAAPAALMASSPSYNAVSLTWTDNSTNETGFRLERAPSGGAFAALTILTDNSTSYVDHAVAASTAYDYRVFAVNGIGDSLLPAGPASVTTLAMPVFGGGGGPVPISYVTIVPVGLSSTIALKVDAAGMVAESVVLEDTGKTVSLAIPVSTRLQTSTGGVLSQLTRTVMSPAPAVPAGSLIVGSAQVFGPDGAVFTPGITLTFKYDPALLPAGSSASDMKIGWWDGTAWQYLTSTVDATAREVRATVVHFTTFALIGKMPAVPVVTPTPTPTVTTTPAPTPTTVTPTTTTPVITPTPTQTTVATPTVTTSTPASTSVSTTTSSPTQPAKSGTNWGLIGGIIAAVVVVLVIIMIVVRRRS